MTTRRASLCARSSTTVFRSRAHRPCAVQGVRAVSITIGVYCPSVFTAFPVNNDTIAYKRLRSIIALIPDGVYRAAFEP